MRHLLLTAALLAAASPLAAEPAAEPVFSPDQVRAHVEFLADDLLEGRDAGTRGYDIAALYVASRFDALGLTPGGTKGWYQPIEFVRAKFKEGTPAVVMIGGKPFANGTDVMMTAFPREADQIVEPGGPEWRAYLERQRDRGVYFSPTLNIYSAGRDVMRARTAEWHQRYTLPSLMRFFQPSRAHHGSYFWDWTTADEIAWRRFYGPWMRLVNDYKNMGGLVTVGSDPGFIYQTWGFSYIQELEMLQEAGFSPLEVIQAATFNGARELYAARGEEPPFGIVRPGMLADLVIVPGNPLANLKLLYGTGHERLNPETQQVERVGGVRWTIKDGIVYDAPALLASVERMVAEARAREAAR